MRKIFLSLLLIPSISLAFGGYKELTKTERNEFLEKGFFSITSAYDKEKFNHQLALKSIEVQMEQNYIINKGNAMKSKDPKEQILVHRDKLPDYLKYHNYQNLRNISFYNSTNKSVKRLDIYFNNESNFDDLSDDEIWRYNYMSSKYWEERDKVENKNLSDHEVGEKVLKEHKSKFIESMKEKNKVVSISIEMDVKPHSVGSINFLLPFERFSYSSWFLEKVWVE